MNILNIMLGQGKGGLEQAAIDYAQALDLAEHHVTTIIRDGAWAHDALAEHHLPARTLSPTAEWSPFAARALRALQQDADLVIAHGNRAIGLALKAFKGRIPVVGVAHNYNIKKRFPKCDAVFSITRDLIEEMVHLDMPRSKLFHIPNMIRLPDITPRTSFNAPPTIASMGRFVDKKGFDVMIEALGMVAAQGIAFKAIIGGDGENAPQLQALASHLQLDDKLTFTGWVADKQAFFNEADLFIVPSHHEPFGIVLIEAMATGLPCITTDTEGPCEIIKQHHDAVMVPKANPAAMAEAIIECLAVPDLTLQLGVQARKKAENRYDISVVSNQLNQAVTKVMGLASDA